MSRWRSLRAVAMAVLIVCSASVVGIALGPGAAVGAPTGNQVFPSNTDFGGTVPSNWTLSGNASWGEDVKGNESLRLTTADETLSGAAFYNQSFVSERGIVSSFKYYSDGGSGADGFTFFLVNGSAVNKSNFHAGVSGGSLGYAQGNQSSQSNPNGGKTGVPHAYLGAGFDEFGNFANPTEGRQGGPGERSQSVTLRGVGNGTEGYEFLTTKDVSENSDIVPGSEGIDGGWRRVRLSVIPIDTNDNETVDAANLQVQMSWDGGNTYHEVIDYTYDKVPPTQYKLGYAGSTGGQTNTHAIGTLSVTKPADLSVTTTDSPAGLSHPGDSVSYSFNVTNNGPNDDDNITVTDGIPTGSDGLTDYSWSYEASGTTVTGDQPDIPLDLGDGESVNITVTGTAGSNFTGDLTHTVSATTGGQYRDPTPSDGSKSVEVPTTNFGVTIDGTNGPVTAGDDLLVNATVTNNGGTTDTQTIALGINGTQNDTNKVMLDPGNSIPVNFTYTTDGDDVPAVNASVSSADSSNNTTVAVNTPANFAVTIDETNESVAPGEDIVVNATVENTGGTSDSQSINLTVNGSVVGNETVTLGPGNSKNVNFTYTTSDDDVPAVNVSVSSSDGSVETIVSVSTPMIEVSRTDIDFGGVRVGTNATKIVTVSNDGNAPLYFNPFLKNESDFSFVGGDGNSRTLAPNQDRNVTVAFAPNTTGPQSAELRLPNNASSTKRVDLNATGTRPAIDVNRTDIDFGNVGVNGTATATLDVTNTGNASLFVNPFVSGNGAFTVDDGTVSRVGVDESRNVTIEFAPNTTGPYSETFKIANNATDDPDDRETVSVDLEGAGVAPRIEIAPQRVAYGNVSVGENVTKNVTVNNTGSAPLNVTETFLKSTANFPDASAFEVTSNAPFVLDPTESQNVTVEFAPEATGDKRGLLAFAANNTAGPSPERAIILDGTGVAPKIEVDPQPLTFGDVMVNQTATAAFTVTNNGSAPLNVTGAVFDQTGKFPNASAFEVFDPSMVLAPGENTIVTVEFTPTSTGEKRAYLRVQNNDTLTPDSAFEFQLVGTGVVPDIDVNRTDLDYGTVTVNESATKTVTISNTGNATLNVTDASTSSDNASEFTVASEDQSFEVAPGASREATVTFTPRYITGTCGRSASLEFTSNDPDESPANVTLSGTARPGVVDTGYSAGPATDPEGDCQYEDVNGDGRFTGADRTALLLAIANFDPAVVNNPAAFDFNNDGMITNADVNALFMELVTR